MQSKSYKPGYRSLAMLVGIMAGALLSSAVHAQPAIAVQCIKCVDTTDIAIQAVTGAQLAIDAVNTTRIKDFAVTTPKIANQAVTGAQLAVDAVNTTRIKNGAVTKAKIATGAVGSNEIANGTIMPEDLGFDLQTQIAVLRILEPKLVFTTLAKFPMS